jgi:hypothetical protein
VKAGQHQRSIQRANGACVRQINKIDALGAVETLHQGNFPDA